jgi:hypothetical protein
VLVVPPFSALCAVENVSPKVTLVIQDKVFHYSFPRMIGDSRRLGWRKGRHVEQFGVKQLRALTVTTSAQRIETMLDALHEATNGKGSELFLFIEDDAVRATNPLDAVWITGKGRECRIID